MDEYLNRIIQGDALLVLKQMPSEFVDTIITSPPYWGLRDYGEETKGVWGGDMNCEHEWGPEIPRKYHKAGETNPGKEGYTKNAGAWGQSSGQFCQRCGAWYGQLGLEPTLDLFIEHLLEITKELKRVLKPTGIMFWNQGDCYHSHGSIVKTSGGLIKKAMERNPAYKDAVNMQRGNFGQIPQKCLALQNYRLVLKMIDEQGWILRNQIIWHKSNHLPSPVKDRFTNAYEPIFMLVKCRKYWFDLDAVRQPWKQVSLDRVQRAVSNHHKYIGKREMCGGGGLTTPRPNIKHLLKEIHPCIFGDMGNVNFNNNPPPDIRICPKYLQGAGHSNRQGLNRPLNEETIKAYKEYQYPIANYIKQHIRPEHKPILDNEFGQHKWHHWIRTDYSGAVLPGIEDWKKLKAILRLDDTFDKKIQEAQKLNIPIFQSGSNPGDIWKLPTQPFKGAHFSTFPEKLIQPMILAGCPKRGIVLDPFMGSGTTALVALKLGRNFIGIEKNPEYVKIAYERIKPALEEQKLL